MSFSGNAIKKLGKRLRDGGRAPDDIAMLESYRASFDDLLIDTTMKVGACLRAAGLGFVTAGRSKRTKSIIRKLQRSSNYGMDLSRMSDLVGCRVILKSVPKQQKALDVLVAGLQLKDTDDYRESKGYRSVHLIARDGKRLIEIQVRTLVQHVWAVESESFGEQAKEGGGMPEEREYLEALSEACRRMEEGEAVDESTFADTPLFKQRTPLTGLLNRLKPLLEENTKAIGSDNSSFVIVYNNKTRQLVHKIPFPPENREAAIKEYTQLGKRLSPDNFETLILNASTDKVLAVTHPIFFS